MTSRWRGSSSARRWATAVEAGLANREALAAAAALIAADQQADGAWRLDSSQSLGSPATYGTALATSSARRVIVASGLERLAPAAARAGDWLRSAQPAAVLDASAVLLGLGRDTDERARAQRTRCLEILRKGQAPDGGWGPYVTSASEPFDTAAAMLALLTLSNAADLASPVFTRESLKSAVLAGRRYLIATQRPDGSWPETTRPAGQESYAQRLSTAGWATLALLASSAL
jgi:hypothetical protein